MATSTVETRKKEKRDGAIRQLLAIYCENKQVLASKFTNNVTATAKIRARGLFPDCVTPKA